MWLEIKKECPVCCESITKIKFCKDFNNFIIKIIEMGPLDVKESYKLLLNFGKKYDPKVITANKSIYISLLNLSKYLLCLVITGHKKKGKENENGVIILSFVLLMVFI